MCERAKGVNRYGARQSERLLIALLAAAASAASAQQADAPQIARGDRWRFAVWYTVPTAEPSREWIVTSIQGETIEATENGEPLRLTRNLGVLDSPRDASSNPRTLDFPLHVGKRWEYPTDWTFKPKGSRGHSQVAVTVEAYERVRVPAGEFDAFRLSSSEALSGTSPINSQIAATTRRTYWYAPAARAIVKIESRNPYLGPSTVELVALELR